MCLMVVILLHQVGGISTKGMDEPLRCYGRSYLELYGSVIRLKDVPPAQPQLVEQGCMVVWRLHLQAAHRIGTWQVY